MTAIKRMVTAAQQIVGSRRGFRVYTTRCRPIRAECLRISACLFAVMVSQLAMKQDERDIATTAI